MSLLNLDQRLKVLSKSSFRVVSNFKIDVGIELDMMYYCLILVDQIKTSFFNFSREIQSFSHKFLGVGENVRLFSSTDS